MLRLVARFGLALVLLAGAVCGQAVDEPGGAPRDGASAAAGDDPGAAAADLAARAEPDGAASARALLGPGPLGALRATELDDAFPPDPPGTLACEGLLNGDFTWLADHTTDPDKYGAYWRGAFDPAPGAPGDRVVPEGAGAPVVRGTHSLRLAAGEPPVVQKIVADERWTDRLRVALQWGTAEPGADAALRVTLRDGPGRTVTRVIEPGDPSVLAGIWSAGAAFVEQHGAPPVPRLELELVAERGAMLVDAVSARVLLPAAQLDALVPRLEAHVLGALETWWLPRGEGGLGLVDPDTGRVRAEVYDVVTGEIVAPRRQSGFHTIHDLLIRWLRLCRAAGRDDEVARWTPRLEASMRRVLDEHFDRFTHLPYNRDVRTGKPMRQQAVTVASWIDLLLDARGVLDDEALREELLAQARRTADTLVQLQRVHDKDPERFPNELVLVRDTGEILGDHPNWFGHLPNKIDARGGLDQPRRYNTAWAVVSGRSFWYHLLKSPAAVMRVHALRPAEGDLAAIGRALQQFERPWDAARYDLENDTDDHYGYLMEDGMALLRAAKRAQPSPELSAVIARAEELVRGATHHRLEPRWTEHGRALWIQAVRLGTACAGDSPRAFRGLLELMRYAPAEFDTPYHREALLELAANDFKGRQLTNGQFTESFFQQWEMVCICYHGTYQGDCRERPWSEWQGDVGDIFGGPPMSSLAAQLWAWEAAEAARRPAILARFAAILDVSERDLLREHGFVFGLDPEIARQYELPEKYTHGLVTATPAGLGTVMTLAKALEVFAGLD